MRLDNVAPPMETSGSLLEFRGGGNNRFRNTTIKSSKNFNLGDSYEFTGPVILDVKSFECRRSLLSITCSATNLKSTALRLHQSLLHTKADASESTDKDEATPFSRFHSSLEELLVAIRPEKDRLHRLQLIYLQDYATVLMRAFHLFSDIDNSLNKHKVQLHDAGPAEGSDGLGRKHHMHEVDALTEQLQALLQVIYHPSNTVAQELAVEVRKHGDQHASRFRDGLDSMDRQVRQSQRRSAPNSPEGGRAASTIAASFSTSRASGDSSLHIKDVRHSTNGFENVLKASIVYSRVQKLRQNSNTFSLSTRPSSIRSSAWDALAFVSMADASIISLIGLPIEWSTLSRAQQDDLSVLNEGGSQLGDVDSLTLIPVRDSLHDDGDDDVASTQTEKEPSLIPPGARQKLTTTLRSFAAVDIRRKISMNARGGDLRGLEAVLLSGGKIDVNFVNRASGRTPLQEAAKAGHIGIVARLLTVHNINVNATDRDGTTPLTWAVLGRHTKIIELLITHPDIDVNKRGTRELTPLALAVTTNYAEGVEVLLGAEEIEADSGDDQDRTLLGIAAEQGYWQIAQTLIQANATSINVRSRGTTPLCLAVGNDHLLVVKVLLAAEEIEVSATDEAGSMPLQMAVVYKDIAILQAMIDSKRIDVDLPDYNHRTSLFHAASSGKTEMVKALIRTRQVDLNRKDQWGQSPVFTAAWHGYAAVVELLLSTGEVDADSCDKLCRTPLTIAASKGHVKVVKVLLYQHAIEAARTKGMDDIHWMPVAAFREAARNGHVDVIKDLIKAVDSRAGFDNIHPGLLIRAARADNFEEFERLLAYRLGRQGDRASLLTLQSNR